MGLPLKGVSEQGFWSTCAVTAAMPLASRRVKLRRLDPALPQNRPTGDGFSHAFRRVRSGEEPTLHRQSEDRALERERPYPFARPDHHGANRNAGRRSAQSEPSSAVNAPPAAMEPLLRSCTSRGRASFMPCRADAVCVSSATKHHGASSLMATAADSRLTRAARPPSRPGRAPRRRAGAARARVQTTSSGSTGGGALNDREVVHRGCVAKPDGDADRPAA